MPNHTPAPKSMPSQLVTLTGDVMTGPIYVCCITLTAPVWAVDTITHPQDCYSTVREEEG